MATSAWPSVVPALVTIATANTTTARVSRGRAPTDDPGDFLMIGVPSVSPNGGWDGAGSFDQEFQTFGGARKETGRVNCLAVSRNGDGDPDLACTTVFALVMGYTDKIRATPDLGLVPTFDYVVTQIETGTVTESSNDEGAMASLSFVVHYQARI